MTNNTTSFRFDTPEDSSGFLLWQVTSVWQRGIKQALKKYNITHTQFVILASLLWFLTHKKETNQAVVSAQTHIDPMTTSTVLRTLQRRGLVHRVANRSDSRAKTITLTAKGKHIATQAVKKVEQFDDLFFAVLGNKKNGLQANLRRLVQQ